MKNKKDNITIYQMEKSSIEYKKSHTIQVSGLTDNEPPKWFVNFLNNDFKKIIDRLDKIESRLDKNDQMWEKQMQFNEMILKRIDNLVAKNNLKE